MLRCAALAIAVFAASLVAAGLATSSPGSAQPPLIRYGDDPGQFGQLQLPELDVDSGEPPVVVLIHGGFWKRGVGDLSIMDQLAERFVDEGFAVWNVEYGRTGEGKGGWPHTFHHLGQAIDHLAVLQADAAVLEADAPLDLGRVVVVGHSAGGHLALWLGTRGDIDGEEPHVTPHAVAALAPIVDLEQAWADDLGTGAVEALLGSPSEYPNRYEFASVQRPSQVPTLVVVSPVDEAVPPRYSEGAPRAETVELSGEVGHLEMLNGKGAAIDEVLRWYRTIE